MAMLLAVLIAVVLIAAASALLVVQLQSRRSSTGASNRELAEAAARTGLSRIETLINNGCGNGSVAIGCNAYRYLWEVSSGINNSNWDAAASAAGGPTIRPLLDQPCSFIPITSADLAVLEGGAVEGGRQDGGGTISSRYSLRSYSKSGSIGLLAVEGLTERTVNGNKIVVARNLITKTFEISDLGVSRKNMTDSAYELPQIAGRNLVLGESTASRTQTTGGVQLLLLDSQAKRDDFIRTDACDSSRLFNEANIYSGSRIGGIGVWPVFGQSLPGSGWFDANIETDKNSLGGERVWQCDDSGCNYSADVEVSGSVIRMPESKICVGNTAGRPCRVAIKSIDLASRTLMVEVQSRPVIFLISYGGYINLYGAGRICPVNAGSTSCLTSNPERFVIYSGSVDDTVNCSAVPVFGDSFVSIAGSSLPSAFVVLPEVTFRATSAVVMSGVIWADQICAPSGLTLSYGTATPGPGPGVLARASSLYSFPTSAPVGRYWIGARGTTVDPLQPWQ